MLLSYKQLHLTFATSCGACLQNSSWISLTSPSEPCTLDGSKDCSTHFVLAARHWNQDRPLWRHAWSKPLSKFWSRKFQSLTCWLHKLRCHVRTPVIDGMHSNTMGSESRWTVMLCFLAGRKKHVVFLCKPHLFAVYHTSPRLSTSFSVTRYKM